jgi:hypothetical protein
MRIASAPNQLQTEPEPQINWPIADQRRRLHYHLCNVFPKKDVETAMNMYPDEANAQKICSAILNIQSLRQS